MQTLRFKSPSVVKINKLGPVRVYIAPDMVLAHKPSQLVNNFKELRASALSALKEISRKLIKQGEYFGTAESRKSQVTSCSTILSPQVNCVHDAPC